MHTFAGREKGTTILLSAPSFRHDAVHDVADRRRVHFVHCTLGVSGEIYTREHEATSTVKEIWKFMRERSDFTDHYVHEERRDAWILL